jgi:hypothetical protein
MLNSVKNCNKAIYAIYLKPYNELGQMFLTPNGELCILAQVAPSSIALINLEYGNRIEEMYKVKNVLSITVKELNCYDEDFPDYKPVDAKITVTI